MIIIFTYLFNLYTFREKLKNDEIRRFCKWMWFFGIFFGESTINKLRRHQSRKFQANIETRGNNADAELLNKSWWRLTCSKSPPSAQPPTRCWLNGTLSENRFHLASIGRPGATSAFEAKSQWPLHTRIKWGLKSLPMSRWMALFKKRYAWLHWDVM